MYSSKKSMVFLLLMFTIISCEHQQIQEPKTVFLTWQQDPTTTMTVDWHTEGLQADPVLKFRIKGESDWTEVLPKTHGFPFSERKIHRVELTGLKPGTRYEFRFDEISTPYWFKTIPSTTDQPVRFVAGGDVRGSVAFDEMTKVAAKLNPDFIVLGGDLAYANGEPVRKQQWYDFMSGFFEILKEDSNRVVPIMAAIGNHEIWGEHNIPDSLEIDYYRHKYGLYNGDSPYFDSLFAFPQNPTYGVLDFGNYLSWFILDSNHKEPVIGDQSEWLENVLKERTTIPNLLASYHVPAYPSYRPFDGGTSVSIRENWVPLFEKYGLDIAFENHDHTYKRTYPLKAGEIVEDGVVFIGDGAWGVDTREFEEEPRWYLEKMVSQNHVIMGTILNNELELDMVNVNGKYIDAYPMTAQKKERIIHTDQRLLRKTLPQARIIKIHESDSVALVDFYRSTNGENWNTNTNWLNGPIATWYGITTKGNRVSRIYLSDNNLRGKIPESLSSLTGMERLYIQDNENLSGILPNDIGNMKALSRIRMSGNNLSGKIPASIGELEDLEQLLLSGNNIEGEFPVELTSLKLLRELDLSHNNLTGKIPSEIGNMGFRLSELDLSENNFEGEIPSAIKDLRFLKELNLSGNSFSNIAAFDIED